MINPIPLFLPITLFISLVNAVINISGNCQQAINAEDKSSPQCNFDISIPDTNYQGSLTLQNDDCNPFYCDPDKTLHACTNGDILCMDLTSFTPYESGAITLNIYYANQKYENIDESPTAHHSQCTGKRDTVRVGPGDGGGVPTCRNYYDYSFSYNTTPPPPTTTEAPPTTSAESATTSTEAPTTSTESATTSTEAPTTSAESTTSTSTESATTSTKITSTSAKSSTTSTKITSTSAKSSTTSTKITSTSAKSTTSTSTESVTTSTKTTSTSVESATPTACSGNDGKYLACCSKNTDCIVGCFNGFCTDDYPQYKVEPIGCIKEIDPEPTSTSAASTPTPTPDRGGGDLTPTSPCFTCWFGGGLGVGPSGSKCKSTNDCSGYCSRGTCKGGTPLPACAICYAGTGAGAGIVGAVCYKNNDCSSSVCTNHLCASPLIDNSTSTTTMSFSDTTRHPIFTTIHGTPTTIYPTSTTASPIITTIHGTPTTIYPIITTTHGTPTTIYPIITTIHGTPTTIYPIITTTHGTPTTIYPIITTTHGTPTTTAIHPTNTPTPQCISGYCGLKTGKGQMGACCSTNDDCKDTCNSNGKCGIYDGTHEPLFGCGKVFCGHKQGNGPTGARCSSSADCKDTCNSNGRCGFSNGTGEPIFGCDGKSFTCTRGYCDLKNGHGPTNACCFTSDDCLDTCNSNGKCGVSDDSGLPTTNICK